MLLTGLAPNAKCIINCGISRVVFARDYPTDFDWFALTPGIEVRHLSRTVS